MQYTRSDGTVELTTLQVAGVNLPCPSEMNVSLEDLHGESKRNASGYLVSDIIRHNVVKIHATWKYLSAADYSVLQNAFPRSGMFFPVRYTDGNAESTITAYKGALSRAAHRLMSTGRIDGYTGVSVDLIER